MRAALLLAGAALLAAASPAPRDPGAVLAAAPASAWRTVPADELLVMDTAAGRMVIRLAPGFAPAHVAAIKALVAAGRFDGGAITRVQDNYVVQWAARPENGGPPPARAPANARPQRERPRPLPAEYERDAAGLVFTPLAGRDAYAEAGFVDGWPVGRGQGKAWLAHCYGMVGVGRDMPPDTGDGAELYAVIGHGPRHLDRNIALVGRVLAGMETHAALKRGTADLGFYATDAEKVPIIRARLASSLAEPPSWQVLDTASPSFAEWVQARANRGGFFVRPAGAIDLCNALPPVRPAP